MSIAVSLVKARASQILRSAWIHGGIKAREVCSAALESRGGPPAPASSALALQWSSIHEETPNAFEYKKSGSRRCSGLRSCKHSVHFHCQCGRKEVLQSCMEHLCGLD